MRAPLQSRNGVLRARPEKQDLKRSRFASRMAALARFISDLTEASSSIDSPASVVGRAGIGMLHRAFPCFIVSAGPGVVVHWFAPLRRGACRHRRASRMAASARLTVSLRPEPPRGSRCLRSARRMAASACFTASSPPPWFGRDRRPVELHRRSFAGSSRRSPETPRERCEAAQQVVEADERRSSHSGASRCARGVELRSPLSRAPCYAEAHRSALCSLTRVLRRMKQ